MSASNNVIGLVSVVRQTFLRGPQGGKVRKRATIRITDATNGLAIGGTTNTIKLADMASVLPGWTYIDKCTNMLVYTTATGAVVKIVPCVPNYDGSLIVTQDAANATAANQSGPADVAISTAQTGQLTIEGF